MKTMDDIILPLTGILPGKTEGFILRFWGGNPKKALFFCGLMKAALSIKPVHGGGRERTLFIFSPQLKAALSIEAAERSA